MLKADCRMEFAKDRIHSCEFLILLPIDITIIKIERSGSHNLFKFQTKPITSQYPSSANGGYPSTAKVLLESVVGLTTPLRDTPRRGPRKQGGGDAPLVGTRP